MRTGHFTTKGEWPTYTADLKGTRISPLDQMSATNFNQLDYFPVKK
jgi:glucose dehydrogenase